LKIKIFQNKIACNNICIKENKIFQVNKILVDIFQKEAKSLKIDTFRETENNTKLIKEGNLQNKVRGIISDERQNSNKIGDNDRNFIYFYYFKFKILFSLA
jgi:hypothetical protein